MAFDNSPSKLEAAFVQRNETNQYYEQINISGSSLVVYMDESGSLTADNIGVWSAKYNIGQSASFDGNRSITRSGYTGLNVGGMNITTFLDNFFFPSRGASVSINSGVAYYETGSSPNITVNGVITPNDETLFGTGSVHKNGVAWNAISSVPPYSYSFVDTGVRTNVSYETIIQTTDNGNSDSGVTSVTFIYPFLYGVSSTLGLTGTALYNALSLDISPKSNKTYSITGNETYLFVAYPASYGNLTSAFDPNLFRVLSAYNKSVVSVTSTGLTVNWTINYNVYRWSVLADFSGNYQFIF